MIAFIPARCGSKSIPLKNIKMFCGKPLIWWNLNQLQQVKAIDEIVVATDCDKISDMVNGFGMSRVVVYRRSEENAQDHSSSEQVMLEYIELSSLAGFDAMMLVQCTSVFTTQKHFRESIEKYISGNYDSLLSCTESKQFFWNEAGEAINYDHKKRPRRQDFSGQYVENGALYISKISSILENRNRISGNIGIYEMPAHSALELDEPMDWLIAESIMEKIIGDKYPEL